MKKAYVKPAIYIENFTLAQSVAAGGCGAFEGTPAYASKFTCGWSVGNFTVWTADACKGPDDLVLDPDVPFENICYNNPDGNNAIFSAS